MLKPFDVCFPESARIWVSLQVILLQGRETEHNWAAREQAILLVRGMLKGDVHLRYMDIFLGCLKEGFIQWSLKTVCPPRADVSL
jgi:CLIP-associating protein 1/2